MNYEYVWHAYPESQSPLDMLTESFEDRMETIDTIKSQDETPEQIAQIKLFIKKFEGEIPPSLIQADAEYWKARAEYDKAEVELDKAWAELNKAEAERDKAWAELYKAGAEFDKAWADLNKARTEFNKLLFSPEVMVLHSEQCGCNWSPTNNNIFNLTKPEKD